MRLKHEKTFTIKAIALGFTALANTSNASDELINGPELSTLSLSLPSVCQENFLENEEKFLSQSLRNQIKKLNDTMHALNLQCLSLENKEIKKEKRKNILRIIIK
jgi:TolA-binding protein